MEGQPLYPAGRKIRFENGIGGRKTGWILAWHGCLCLEKGLSCKRYIEKLLQRL